MKILLTGPTGFLGTHLLRALVENNHMVIGLKRRNSNISKFSNIKGQVSFFDIEDGLEHLFNQCRNIELVIHTATCYGNKGKPLSEILKTNVLLPLHIMELASLHKNCTFINTDTFFCKAEDGYAYLAEYIVTKKLFYQLGTHYALKNNCSFINIRLEHMYGPGDGPEKFIPSILRKMMNHIPEITLTLGEQVRDFVYIDDVVNAYIKIINSRKTMENRGVSYFEVGGGMVHSIKDFVTIAHTMIKSKSNLLFGVLSYRENEIMYSKANVENLLRLGWQNNINLEMGLKHVISSLQQQEIQ